MKRLKIISIMSSVIFSCLVSSYGQVEIVGHRGASFAAPENTLASVKKAVELGADAVEIDIHLSRDGQIVVIHDDNTKRTTNQNFRISETDYAVLSRLDAGSYKSEKYAGEKIPLLKDILDYLPEHVNIYIEIKSPINILPTLQKIVCDHHKKKQFRIIAFDLETITEAKKLLPDIPCYYLKSSLVATDYDKFVEELKMRGLDGADLHFESISANLVEKLNYNGLICLAWTVNSVEKVKELIEIGVLGITTDKPGLIKKGLQ